MTADKTYRCNLCRERIADVLRRDGVGIHYCGQMIEFRDVLATENHICKACLKSLRELLPLTREGDE